MITISVKLSEDEALIIRANAHKEKLSVSAYLRSCATTPAPASQKPRLTLCPLTGCYISRPYRRSFFPRFCEP
ncbi:MAG: hypothetical protein SH807_11240 [Blastochloris sp.]|nr:hypothetical protein [Blastochloris sp.]